MKSYLFALTLALLCFSSCGMKQNRAVKDVIKSVEKTNKTLPIDYGVYSLDKMEVDEKNNLCINYLTLDDEQRDFDRFMAEFEETALTNFSMSFDGVNRFPEALVKSKLDLKYVIKAKHSNLVKEVLLTAKQLEEASKNKVSTKDLLIDAVEKLQETVPVEAGHGLVITDILIDGDYLVYKAKNDESEIPMQDLEMAQKQGPVQEEKIIESFNTSKDPSVNYLAKLLKEAGMGVKYIYYTDKSSIQVDAYVSPQQFKKRVRDKK